MAELTRRLEILIDETRYERLEECSRQTGASIDALVRDAIDRAYPTSSGSVAEAARRLLEAEPMPVDDWEIMKREIEEMYEPRGDA
jgi:hypothetical protein